MMASAQVVETSVNTNSPSQDYTTNPNDHSNHNIFHCVKIPERPHNVPGTPRNPSGIPWNALESPENPLESLVTPRNLPEHPVIPRNPTNHPPELQMAAHKRSDFGMEAALF